MGYNYTITQDDQLEINGFNCEEDLQATKLYNLNAQAVDQRQKTQDQQTQQKYVQTVEQDNQTKNREMIRMELPKTEELQQRIKTLAILKEEEYKKAKELQERIVAIEKEEIMIKAIIEHQIVDTKVRMQ